MTEQTLVWVKRPPGRKATTTAEVTDHAQLSAALAQACTDCGARHSDFIAAAGSFGSWLLELQRDERRQRIIWNGQLGELVLEAASPHAGWDELDRCQPSSRDPDGLVAGVRRLLATGSEAEGTGT
ncbi:MAG: hypothetical protein JJT85_09095 [Chromatiales bacterium]|nr:hypothetical protein [Chromatiales bacterium]